MSQQRRTLKVLFEVLAQPIRYFHHKYNEKRKYLEYFSEKFQKFLLQKISAFINMNTHVSARMPQ